MGLVVFILLTLSLANKAQGATLWDRWFIKPQLEAILPQQTAILDPKEVALDARLVKLANCESNNNPKAINPNDGGSPSYGLYQWKVDSFYRYNQKYEILPDLERQEVMNIIYDPDIQTKLTRRVLEDGGWRNWKNCWKKINDTV